MISNREDQLKSFYDAIAGNSQSAPQNHSSGKDNQKAGELQSEGDQLSSQGLYINAIDKYNESLCYLEPDAPEQRQKFREVYVKRASALFRMNLPKECLKSLGLAGDETDNHAEQIIDMMNQCQEKIKLLDDRDQCKFQLKIGYSTNVKIPFMADCLELWTSDQFGRFIITTKNLKVGDVVMIEQPFVSYLRLPMRYKRCANCMTGERRASLIPCTTCTKALYCSKECQSKAWNNYHQYECRLSDNLDDVDATEHVGRSLRALLTGVSVYGGLREYQEYIAEHAHLNTTAFDLDYSARDRKREFLVLHNMQFLDKQISDRRYFYAMAANWTNILVNSGVFGQHVPEDLVRFLLNTIYRYTVTSIVNSYGTYVSLNGKMHPVASTQHLTTTMFNHSCSPNIQRVEQNGSKVIMVIRPIPKGGQLFDKYGKGFQDMSREQRQDYYSNQYGFECKCVACEEDYPMAKDLETRNGLETIERFDPQTMSKDPEAYLDKVFEYLQENDQLYPCTQMVDAQSEVTATLKLLLAERILEEEFRDYYREEESDVGTFDSDNE